MTQVDSRQPKPSSKPSSHSSTPERDDAGLSIPMQDVPSPVSSSSLSPPPNEAATSFDQFAPLTAGVDPFNPYAIEVDDSAYAMNIPDLATMNFHDILELTDPSSWPDLGVPGL